MILILVILVKWNGTAMINIDYFGEMERNGAINIDYFGEMERNGD